MAYYLMVEKKRSEYQPLILKNSKYFNTPKSKFKAEGAHSLEEIDRFTTQFPNELELRRALSNDGILERELVTKPISIRILHNGEYKKVMYDLLYQDSAKYLNAPSRIISLIMEKYHNNDFVFIRNLAQHFIRYKVCSSTAPEVSNLAQKSIYQGYRDPELDKIDNNNDNIVIRMIKLLIIEHKEYPDGFIMYYQKINHRNLHELVAYIKHLEPQLPKNLESLIEKPPVKPKTKTLTKNKKNYILDDQESFEI